MPLASTSRESIWNSHRSMQMRMNVKCLKMNIQNSKHLFLKVATKSTLLPFLQEPKATHRQTSCQRGLKKQCCSNTLLKLPWNPSSSSCHPSGTDVKCNCSGIVKGEGNKKSLRTSCEVSRWAFERWLKSHQARQRQKKCDRTSKCYTFFLLPSWLWSWTLQWEDFGLLVEFLHKITISHSCFNYVPGKREQKSQNPGTLLGLVCSEAR